MTEIMAVVAWFLDLLPGFKRSELEIRGRPFRVQTLCDHGIKCGHKGVVIALSLNIWVPVPYVSWTTGLSETDRWTPKGGSETL